MSIKQQIARDLAQGPAWIRSYQHQKAIIDEMVRAGHVGRTKPARGKGRNMIGLTAAGAHHFGLDVPQSDLIEPLIAQIPQSKRRVITADERAHHTDIIAEHVANGGDVIQCAEMIGMSKAYCGNLWRALVRDLGWQAV